MAHPAWAALLRDCQGKVEEYSYKVIHGIPVTSKDEAEQNYLRGKVGAFEDLLGLAEELKEWRKEK